MEFRQTFRFSGSLILEGSRLALWGAAIVLLAVVFQVTPVFAQSTDAQTHEEYTVKAAFCHKFLFFTDWPEAAFPDQSSPITIGIIGKDPFGDSFEEIASSAVLGRPLIVVSFGSSPTTQQIHSCHLVFIARSERRRLPQILEALSGSPTLTVSDLRGFVDAGGMIGLTNKQDRVHIEINRGAAENAGLSLRSKLLRVADRVLEGGQ